MAAPASSTVDASAPAPKRPTRGARAGGALPTLPVLLVGALVVLGGMVARDHLLPVLRPATAAAASGSVAAFAAPSIDDPVAAVHESTKRVPLLIGDPARHALDVSHREELLRRAQPAAPIESGIPPAL